MRVRVGWTQCIWRPARSKRPETSGGPESSVSVRPPPRRRTVRPVLTLHEGSSAASTRPMRSMRPARRQRYFCRRALALRRALAMRAAVVLLWMKLVHQARPGPTALLRETKRGSYLLWTRSRSAKVTLSDTVACDTILADSASCENGKVKRKSSFKKEKTSRNEA